MDFNRAFDILMEVKAIPLHTQLIELLQKTWANISVECCTTAIKRKRPNESVSPNDIARVELFADDVRSAVYSNMNRWTGTADQRALDEWFDLQVSVQNALLIEAFPDGRVYGV